MTIETISAQPAGRFLAGRRDGGAHPRDGTGRVRWWASSRDGRRSLKTALSICLGSRHPIVIWWGGLPYTQFYNDAYISLLGHTNHPFWLGRSGRDCWK